MRTRKFATIDSALTKNADSDYTGITKNYVNEKNDWNIAARRYKINSKELINIIFQLHDDNFEEIGIEEGAFTHAVKPFYDDECRVRNKYPRLIMLKHGGVMKETRIRGLIPRYSAGTIYHIIGECDDLEEELLRFPKAPNDDVSDSEQYQNVIAKPPFMASPTTVADEEVQNLYDDIGI
jgi:phage terminase large subunit-like protein